MSKKIFENASQTRKLAVGTTLVEKRGILIHKVSPVLWAEFFETWDGVDTGTFRAREIEFPARRA